MYNCGGDGNSRKSLEVKLNLSCRMDLLLLLVSLAALSSESTGFQESRDVCGRDAYLQHVSTHRIRTQAGVSIDFHNIRTDLKWLKDKLGKYLTNLELEVQIAYNVSKTYDDPSHKEIANIPQVARYDYFKVDGKYANALKECADKYGTLPAVPTVVWEKDALVALMQTFGTVEQPLDVTVKDEGIYDNYNHQLVKTFGDGYTATMAKLRPVFRSETSGNNIVHAYLNSKLAKDDPEVVLSFICKKPRKQYAMSNKATNSFLSIASKARQLNKHFVKWHKFVVEFTEQNSVTLGSAKLAIKFVSPAQIREVMDLSEELAVADNFANTGFPLLSAIKEHNEAMTKLFADLRIESNFKMQLKLIDDELVALAPALGKTDLKLEGQVVLTRGVSQGYILEYYDHAENLTMTVYNILPLISADGRVYTDKYLVHEHGSYYTSSVIPVPANCLVDNEQVQTCSPPIGAMNVAKDSGCGDCIIKHGSHAGTLKQTSHCRMSEVGADEWPRNALAEQVIIPNACDQNQNAITLVNLRKGEIVLDCKNMRSRTVLLPTGNFNLPRTCQITRGKQIVHEAEAERADSTQFIGQANALVNQLLDDFGVDEDAKSVWKYTTYWIAIGVSSGLAVLTAVAATCILWCRQTRRMGIPDDYIPPGYDRSRAKRARTNVQRNIFKNPFVTTTPARAQELVVMFPPAARPLLSRQNSLPASRRNSVPRLQELSAEDWPRADSVLRFSTLNP